MTDRISYNYDFLLCQVIELAAMNILEYSNSLPGTRAIRNQDKTDAQGHI
jgi:hypothetical protein